ncbi:hypothetical protein [Chryseobacterium sp. JM1]|nr:hypothetical protein [Chryseobacterium sp. JM1]
MRNYTDDELKRINKTYRLTKMLKKFEFMFYLALFVLIVYWVLKNMIAR